MRLAEEFYAAALTSIGSAGRLLQDCRSGCRATSTRVLTDAFLNLRVAGVFEA